MPETSDYNIGNALAAVAVKQGEECGLVARRKQGKGLFSRKTWQEWTFAQLFTFTCNVQKELHDLGIRPGQRVILMVRPGLEFICLTFALFRLGAVLILIDPGMGYKNLLRCITSVQPDVLVGIPQAVGFSLLFPQAFRSLRQRISTTSIGFFKIFAKGVKEVHSFQDGEEKNSFLDADSTDIQHFHAQREDLAALIFTTGSTGPPKGVQYTHGIFHTQLQYIREYYGIGPGDTDQPGFPLFGLFSIALGAKAVIPDMDPTRPAKVNPKKFADSLLAHKVTYSFGSPAIWNVVSRYCEKEKLVLPLKKVLMAGAPVPGDLIRRVQACLPTEAQIFTPYGATESLPVASIEGREVLAETWEKTQAGHGVCVGRSLPGLDIAIITHSDESIAQWQDCQVLEAMQVGEIVVRGPVVTRAYEGLEKENALAKIADGDRFWHRMGDMGYLDTEGRLWFCGRKAHRVQTAQREMYTICCEAIFNRHPQVYRSALVGIGAPGQQTPILIVELMPGTEKRSAILADLQTMGQEYAFTASIQHFLIHKGFPVDIRHNAKIFREKLAVWAAKQQQLPSG